MSVKAYLNVVGPCQAHTGQSRIEYHLSGVPGAEGPSFLSELVLYLQLIMHLSFHDVFRSFHILTIRNS